MEKTPLELALDALARRDLTRAEVVQRLLQRGFDQSVAEGAADRLAQMKLVDDQRTAQWEAEKHRKDKGHLALEEKLIRRGVDSHVVAGVVQTDPEQERLKAKRFVASKSWKSPAQAARALSSRGFDDECVMTVIEELFPND